LSIFQTVLDQSRSFKLQTRSAVGAYGRLDFGGGCICGKQSNTATHVADLTGDLVVDAICLFLAVKVIVRYPSALVLRSFIQAIGGVIGRRTQYAKGVI
jgi:hypothetical protein